MRFFNNPDFNYMKYFLPLIILIFGFSVFAQNVPINEKEKRKIAKQQEKEQKAQEKAAKQQQKALKKSMEVDADDLNKFPQQFVGRTIIVYGMQLGEINPVSVGEETFYVIQADTISGLRFPHILSSNELAFVTTESLAFEIHNAYKKPDVSYNNRYPAHVWLEVLKTVDNGRSYYVGKV